MRNRPLCTSSYLHFCTNLRLKLSCAYLTSLFAEPGSPLYLSFVGHALWSCKCVKELIYARASCPLVRGDPGWEKVSIRIRDGRKSASGSGISDEQPGSYFLEFRNHFFCFFLGLEYLKSLMRIRDPGWRQFGSGIRDGKKSDLGSGINIPDPQRWF